MTFKKAMLILVISVVGTIFIAMMHGCGRFQRAWTNFTGNVTYKCVITNVVYVQSDSGLAPLLDLNGKPVACSELKEL